MATRSQVGGNLPRRMDPARMLPPEILVRIFRWCDPSRDGVYTNGFLIKETPWLLTHVSSLWRNVAISTPILWRHLSVKFNARNSLAEKQYNNVEGTFHLTNLFLKRSVQCPLEVYISGDLTTAVWPVLERIMTSCERWEALTVFADGPLIQSLVPIKGRLPNLGTLEVTRGDADEESPNTTVDLFSLVPALYEGTFRYDPAFVLLLPWNQLTTLKTGYSEIGPILDTLRQLTNLMYLTLDRFADDTPMEEFPPAYLPRLRELELTIESGEEGHHGALLDCLVLPSLDCLSIDCEDLAVAPHLTALLGRSNCPLDSITLTLLDELDARLAGVLVLTPHLTVLEVTGTIAKDVLLEQLTLVPDSESQLVPRLRELSFRARVDQARVLHLITSRVGVLRYFGLALEVEDIEAVLANGFYNLGDVGITTELLR
ncbi:hypothetical protein C8F04DRAFT_1109087 [Mycena alexandri]|uniref:F-box domain-containing protein n=1 Tax=Mycena alexandri TaxID=1745969 RepID=A0AAD6X0H3_9AGAR|nr:hypothetical protein C8F04DRAFT_1109087 [Mycena alexandri]